MATSKLRSAGVFNVDCTMDYSSACPDRWVLKDMYCVAPGDYQVMESLGASV